MAPALSAQNTATPVTIAVQTRPPFTPNLGTWTDPVNNQVAATLLLNDRTQNGYQVRLRLTIEGMGVTLTTKPEFLPAPIALNFGMPEQLMAVDLREYFDINNLNFSGYSLDTYVQRGGLPPGTYSVCLEAFDYDRNDQQPVSQRACSFLQAQLLDPPAILTPRDEIIPTNPQQLIVQWQPRHVSMNTRYRVEIYGIAPGTTLTPEQIYATQQPDIFVTEDDPNLMMGATSINIDQTFPTLGLGRYLVRVRASEVNASGRYKNGGWSEPVFFEYGGDCPPPGGTEVTVNGPEDATVSWVPESGVASYILRYRAQLPGANWYEEAVTGNSVELSELADSTVYEVQIQSVCGELGGEFGSTYEFLTDAINFDEQEYDCGDDVPEAPEITNQNPATGLAPGDLVQVGQFQMRLIEIAEQIDGGSEKSFEGRGVITVGWMRKTIRCRFASLFINTDRQVYDGAVIAVDEGLASISDFKSVADIIAEADTVATNWCGDSIVRIPDSLLVSGQGDYDNGESDPYANLNPFAGSDYDPAKDVWNPNRSGDGLEPFDPTDYQDPNNPYTEERPFDPNSVYNPFNTFNPYNRENYSDRANPWTALDPWTSDKMFERQGAQIETYTNGWAGQPGSSLPIKIGAGANAVAIYGIRFTTEGASLNAYLSALVPGLNRHVAFEGVGINFTPGGMQGDNKINMITDLTSAVGGIQLGFMGGDNTYVKINCDGLQEVSLKMRATLCRDMAVPLNPYTYEELDGEYVSADFIFRSGSWGDFTARFSLGAFEAPSAPGWAFMVGDAVFDLSETSTLEEVTFPEDYVHADVNGTKGPDSPLWKGLYIKEARVRIPDQFTKGAAQDSTLVDEDDYSQSFDDLFREDGEGDGTPDTTQTDQSINRTIGVQDLIIDNTGFSSTIYGTNIIPLSEGNAGGWAMSLDSVAISIQSDQLAGAALAGTVQVPALDAALGYNGSFNSDEVYTLSVEIGEDDEIGMSAMGATLTLQENSSVTLTYEKEKEEFSAEAVLNGMATFSPSIGATAAGGGSNQNNNSNNNNNPGGSGGNGNGNPSDPRNQQGQKLVLPELTFTEFHITSKAPYIENIGSWELASPGEENQPKVGDFPITLHRVGMYHDAEKAEVAFGVDLSVNLVKPGDQGFGARGKAFVICDVTVNEQTKRQEWKFKRVRFDRLDLRVDGGAYKFAGFLEAYEDDPIYGSGFMGGLNAEFKPKIAVGVVGMFGTVKDNSHSEPYRYFFADALTTFNPGIQLGTTGLAVYGFGGGIAYRMQREGPSPISLSLPFNEAEGLAPIDSTETRDDDDYGQDLEDLFRLPEDDDGDLGDALNEGDPNANAPFPQGIELPSNLGESLSGVTYIPNYNRLIELQASLDLGLSVRETANGRLGFRIAFNNNGGVDEVGMFGQVNLMTPPPTPAEPDPEPGAAFYADMKMDLTPDNESFSAYLRATFNVAGGTLRGAYPGNVAGEGEIYADKDDWWIYIGTPTNPVKFGYDLSKLSNVAGNGDNDSPSDPPNPPNDQNNNEPDTSGVRPPLGTIGDVGLMFGGYLDAGTRLPPFPGLPSQVTSILDEDYSITDRNDPRFGDAKGMMFGLNAEISMADLKFLIFYADFNAGAGLDLMLRNYQNATCRGGDGSPVGINGWYATGQMYAYLQGEIGIDIKLGALKYRGPILEVGVAAVLQAEFPNPWYMRGKVRGEYSVLSGLVKGSCSFKFEVGEQCDMIEQESALEIISAIRPDEEDDVSVFTAPRVTFNLAINQIYPFKDEQERNLQIRPKVSEYRLFDVSSNETIPSTFSLSQDGLTGILTPEEALPGNANVGVKVSVQIEQRAAESNEEWRLAELAGNAETAQTKQVTFRTGEAPTTVSKEVLVYTYPIRNQLNYYPSLQAEGYLKMQIGQGYLFQGQPFNDLDESVWTQQVRFWDEESLLGVSDVTYDAGTKEVRYTTPTDLPLDKIIRMDIVNIPIGEEDDISVNVELVETDIANTVPGNSDLPANEITSIKVRETQQNSTVQRLKVKELYVTHFRTSTHASFRAKVASLELIEPTTYVAQLTTPRDTIYHADGRVETGDYLSLNIFGERIKANEGFDKYELIGDTRTVGQYWKVDTMIRAVALLNETGDNWYNETLKPDFYDRVPEFEIPAGYENYLRDTARLGFPPVRSVRFGGFNLPYYGTLQPSAIATYSYRATPTNLYLQYDLPLTAYRDHAEHTNILWNMQSNGNITPAGLDFLRTYYYYPRGGDYGVELQYFIPGKQVPADRATYQVNNPYNYRSRK